MTLQDKKMKILNQLNATRKDKAADKRKETASDEAVRIFQQIQELQRAQNHSAFDITEITFDDDGNVVEELNIDKETEDEIINNETEESEG